MFFQTDIKKVHFIPTFLMLCFLTQLSWGGNRKLTEYISSNNQLTRLQRTSQTSSSAEKIFKLIKKERPSNFPSVYHIALLDCSYVKFSSKGEGNQREKIKSLINEKARKDDNKIQIETIDRNGQNIYQIIKKKEFKPSLAQNFTTNLSNENAKAKQTAVLPMDNDREGSSTLTYNASLLIIPTSNEEKFLVYLFGNWFQLINLKALEKSFGIKLAVSEKLYREKSDDEGTLCTIKEITSRNYRNLLPSRETQNFEDLHPLGRINIERGSSDISELRLLPHEEMGGNALIRVNDFFEFRIPIASSSKKNQPVLKFIDTLHDISQELYHIFESGSIRKEFKPFFDEPEGRRNYINILNEALVKKENLHHIRLHSIYWSLISYDPLHPQSVPDFYKNLEGITLDMEVNTLPGTHISQVIYSTPMKLDENNQYYRFERGKWFKIHENRFEILEKQLREYELSYENLFLPPYQEGEIQSKDENKENSRNSQEAKYLEKAVAHINKASNPNLQIEGLLLDRRNVSLGGEGNKFELADIFLEKNSQEYYLIHVKRQGSKDIDHHQQQVKRAASYLGENLGLENICNVLIQEVIKEFHAEKLPGKTISHSTYYIDKWKEKGNKGWENFYNDLKTHQSTELKRKHVRRCLSQIIGDYRIKEINKEFSQFGSALGKCIDALHDWYYYDQNYFLKTSLKQKIEDAQFFFEEVLKTLQQYKPLIKLRKTKKKVTIVMAIIMDKKTKDVKKKKNKFLKQELWGINDTRSGVERKGFDFKITWIPDHTNSGGNVPVQQNSLSQGTVTLASQSQPSQPKRGKRPRPSSGRRAHESRTAKKQKTLFDYEEFTDKEN